jgi:hypothetical protein
MKMKTKRNEKSVGEKKLTSHFTHSSPKFRAARGVTLSQRGLFVWALDEAHTHNQILAQFRVAENLDCAGPPAEPPKS